MAGIAFTTLPMQPGLELQLAIGPQTLLTAYVRVRGQDGCMVAMGGTDSTARRDDDGTLGISDATLHLSPTVADRACAWIEAQGGEVQDLRPELAGEVR